MLQQNSKVLETLKKTFPQFFDKDGNFLAERFDKMLKANNVALSKDYVKLKKNLLIGKNPFHIFLPCIFFSFDIHSLT